MAHTTPRSPQDLPRVRVSVRVKLGLGQLMNCRMLRGKGVGTMIGLLCDKCGCLSTHVEEKIYDITALRWMGKWKSVKISAVGNQYRVVSYICSKCSHTLKRQNG